jgi:hypothetical protein
MTNHTELWLIGFILLGSVLLAVAAWQYFSPSGSPGLIVDEPDRDVSDYSAGQTTLLTFMFHNRSRRAVQVLGLEPC